MLVARERKLDLRRYRPPTLGATKMRQGVDERNIYSPPGFLCGVIDGLLFVV
jgi:hypothetical protein